MLSPAFHPARCADEKAVDDSPYDKGPAGTVPKAGYKEGRHRRHIVVAPFRSFFIDGTENIVTQEARQRHMPPSPVILEISRLVRRIKVMRNRDVEHHTQADCHIRIAGKVKIVRHRILDRMKPRADHWQCVRNVSEKCLGIRRQRVRQKDLLRTANRKKEQTCRHMFRIQLQILLILKLWNDLRMMNNRPDDQLWEEGDEQQIVNHVIFLRLPAIRIHQKRDQLKCEEGNTDRKDDVL